MQGKLEVTLGVSGVCAIVDQQLPVRIAIFIEHGVFGSAFSIGCMSDAYRGGIKC